MPTAILDPNLELVCDPQWAVDHPDEAKALYHERLLRKFGLSPEPDYQAVLDRIRPQAKPKPRPRSRPRKRNSKPRSKSRQVHTVPVVDGERMQRMQDVIEKVGVNRNTLSTWCTKGQVHTVVLGNRRYVLASQVQNLFDKLNPPPPIVDGEKYVAAVPLSKRLGLDRHTIGAWVKEKKVVGLVRVEGCHKRLWVSEQSVLDYARWKGLC